MKKKEKKFQKMFIEKINYFFVKKRLKFLSILFFLFLFSFFIFEKLPFFKKTSLESYFSIEKTYNNWQKEESNSLFSKLEKTLKKYPDLASKYEGAIVQKLLYKGDKKAFHKGLTSLEKTKKESWHYFDFSKISLLPENNAKEALFHSIELKEIIEKNKRTDLFLYFFNLLRISFLQKRLGNTKEELFSLHEVEDYITQSKETRIQRFLENFQKNEMFLKDYITHRKKKLSS